VEWFSLYGFFLGLFSLFGFSAGFFLFYIGQIFYILDFCNAASFLQNSSFFGVLRIKSSQLA